MQPVEGSTAAALSLDGATQGQASHSHMSSLPVIRTNAKVSFIVQNIEITNDSRMDFERFYPDYQSAKAQAIECARAELWLKIFQGGKFSAFKIGTPLLKKSAHRQKFCLNSEGFSRGNESTPKKIAELYIQKPKHEDFINLSHFKDLTSLEIDNSFLEESVERMSQFDPQIKTATFFSDKTLLFLEKCPNLTDLKLTNVTTVTTAALLALRKKIPHLRYQLNIKALKPKTPFNLSPVSSDAEVMYRTIHYKFLKNQISVLTKLTSEYEPADSGPDTVGGNTEVLVKAAAGTHTFEIKKFKKREANPLLFFVGFFDGDTALFNIEKDIKSFKLALNMQTLILHNITKKSLAHIKELEQVKKIVINNSSLKAVLEKNTQLAVLKPEDLQPIDDQSIIDLLKGLKSITKILLVGCEGITDAAIHYAERIKKIAFSIETT